MSMSDRTGRYPSLSPLRIKNLLHQLPFVCRGGRGRAALELADVGFPLCLPREGRETRHITLEVEVILRVHYHKQRSPVTINLHLQDADLVLTGNHLGPHVGVHVNVFFDERFVVNERQGLTVPFHLSKRIKRIASRPRSIPAAQGSSG